MQVNNKSYRTVWMEGDKVSMIDQNLLPFEFKIVEFDHYTQVCVAIKDMYIRGAGAIGAAAGFAMAQAFLSAPEDGFQNYIDKARNEPIHQIIVNFILSIKCNN